MCLGAIDGVKLHATAGNTAVVAVTQRLAADTAPGAQTLFVEIRLAAQLIATPPNKKFRPTVKGLGRFVVPKGVTLDFLVEQDWKWRDSHVIPEGKFTQCVLTKTGGDRVNLDGVMTVVGQETECVEASPFLVLTEAQLQDMEKVAPQTAAIARREAQETKDAERCNALTRTVARIQQLIVDQYGWPERD